MIGTRTARTVVFGLLGIMAGLVLPVAGAARPVAAAAAPVMRGSIEMRSADDLSRAAPATRGVESESRDGQLPVPGYLATNAAGHPTAVFIAVLLVMAAVGATGIRPAPARAPPRLGL